MEKMSILLLCVFVVCTLDQAIAMGNYGYYLPAYPAASGDLLSYFPILQPMCAECKVSSESGSSESSSEEGKESASSSEEGKSSEESKGSEESKSSSEEGGEPSSSEEGGSKEEKKEEGKEEGSSEEKKEASETKKSKKIKYVFPPRSYTFPQGPLQQIVYSPGAPYNYMPYRTSYVVQQPVASYPLKTNYKYVSLPGSATVTNTYAAPVFSRILSSPVASVVYSSPAVSYPSVSKSILTPGAQVYSRPVTWNNPVSYYKI